MGPQRLHLSVPSDGVAVGADLIFSVNELKVSREAALANAKKIARGRLTEVLTDLEEMAGVVRFNEVNTASPSEEDRNGIEAYLTECVETVYDYGRRRDCGLLMIDGDRKFAITAGMSWGDEPTDAYESFNVCEILGLTEKEWPDYTYRGE